jgi:hypothetical protein
MRRFDPLTTTPSAIEFYTQKKVKSAVCLRHSLIDFPF